MGTTWESVATVDVPRATLQVEDDSREIRLANMTQQDLDLTFYQISSESGAVLLNRWNGLQDQGIAGWQENIVTANLIAESNFSSETELSSGQFFTFGAAFNKRTQDLVAHVGTADGLLNLANVVYGPIVDEAVDSDFDNNGEVNVADIDLLCSQVASGQFDGAFDLTGDGSVNSDDVGEFLGQSGSLQGDANLDGAVNFTDFLALSTSFGQSDRTWSHGDLNCDGSVAFADFLILSDNFGKAAATVASSVPEPNGLLLMAFAAIGLLGWQSRYQR